MHRRVPKAHPRPVPRLRLARGVPGTFLWRLKKLASWRRLLADAERVKDEENLAEEFADVFAWLTTIANIHEVDLEAAIRDKYIQDGGPEGTK